LWLRNAKTGKLNPIDAEGSRELVLAEEIGDAP
jgi:hypothetical protein